MVMIEVIANDRLGKKVRIKCDSEDTVGDLKVAPSACGSLTLETDCCADRDRVAQDCAEEVVYVL
jgi:hypothetical protein